MYMYMYICIYIWHKLINQFISIIYINVDWGCHPLPSSFSIVMTVVVERSQHDLNSYINRSFQKKQAMRTYN